MDRLKELEKKRKQLQELRDRRKAINDGSLVKKLLEQDRDVFNHDKQDEVLKVSVAVQTDPIQSPKLENVVISSEVLPSRLNAEKLTYDKCIQTDDIKGFMTEPNELNKEEVEIALDEEEIYTPKHSLGEKDIDYFKSIEHLYPMVVEQNHQQIRDELTFSLMELVETNRVDSTRKNHSDNSTYNQYKDKIDFITELTSNFSYKDGNTLNAIEIDSNGPLVLTLYQSKPMEQGNLMNINVSYVEVFNYKENTLIDKLEFHGQTLVSGRFIRKKSQSKVTSILLTSLNGKIYLYELKVTQYIGDSKTLENPKVQRNLIHKNYHYSPVYAIAEFSSTNKLSAFSDDRFLAISNNGVLYEISSLDLSLYIDNSTDRKKLHNIRLHPPRRTDLIQFDNKGSFVDENDESYLDSDEESNNKDNKKSEQQISKEMYLSHLGNIALYDKLTVTTIAVSESNNDMFYVGTEDGGIYRLYLKDIFQNRLNVSLSNNDFLPTNNDLLSRYIFHSSQITSLSLDDSNYLLSTSLDWSCKLWDTVTNRHLSTYDFGSPVLQGDWVFKNSTSRNTIYTACLTWKEFVIIKWELNKKLVTTKTNKVVMNTELIKQPQIVISLTNELASFDYFTSFKLIIDMDDDSMNVLLGGNENNIKVYKIFPFL